MKPWTQFYDMRGSSEKPFAIVKNITLKNIQVTCKQLGEIRGNTLDEVNNFVFQDVDVRAESDSFNVNYDGVSFNNVFINGKSIGNE